MAYQSVIWPWRKSGPSWPLPACAPQLTFPGRYPEESYSIVSCIATLTDGVIHHMTRAFTVGIANRDAHTTTPAYVQGLYVSQKSLLGCTLTNQ